ncbi:uncharacterized protein THITE_2048089 [Thermothielavioides terrestris NRRL 8126]|uniref:Glycoside hydrolase family 127 protein n=1 Tax=Thermothielavioides terrestris (strain ATCC 38088 / NRRL 8126) TaxID=578455 RepID=G2R1U9_THETT|nr:uncharacterized protein THITE_2048089 [Thermothielavioides terrestris NRRL 8126]AEO64925.1 hypothetical protein THITE_2048089 [Thermothielavioides terrestris NRRL 8126]
MAHPQSTFAQTAFHGPSLLRARRTTISRTTVKAQLKQLRDTGRYDCFKLQWHPVYDDKSSWPVPPSLFWDSDVAKWIEGACYLLADEYDEEVDRAVRELVDMIRGAQQPDGYLNVYFTVVEPDKRWSNIRDMHELYNAGHLIEAALAHKNYYHNNLLLEPIEKYVSLIHSVFGPAEHQLHGYPGHPEIELALLRLHAATGSTQAYELARYFVEERGNPRGQDGMHFFDWEARRRGDSPWKRPDHYPVSRTSHWYNQSHAPVLRQTSVEGHAVRAMYLLTAVADLACLDELGVRAWPARDAYLAAVRALWDNMVDRKMYVTGGIGAVKQWEGFGIDYFLPQGTDEGGCYAETCAAIGVMMLAERLLHVDLDARYADVMELCLYNAVMTAMSLDGTAFTYVNQLASSDADRSVRHTWFECSCCPPNLMRLFGNLGGYLWDYGAAAEDGEPPFVNVHLYTTAKVTFQAGGQEYVFEQVSDWPWEGRVSFKLQAPAATTTGLAVRLRIPGWSAGGYTLTPPCPTATLSKGYLSLPASYTAANPTFTLSIHGLSPRLIAPHPYTNQHTLTLARGPVIYCVEDADNPWEANHFRDITLSADARVTEEERTLAGERYVALRTVCRPRDLRGAGPGSGRASGGLGAERELVFVPYYLRANRGGKGHMRVGLLNQSVVM